MPQSIPLINSIGTIAEWGHVCKTVATTLVSIQIDTINNKERVRHGNNVLRAPLAGGVLAVLKAPLPVVLVASAGTTVLLQLSGVA